MELLTRLAGIRFPIVRLGLLKKGYKACFDLAQGQADEIFAGRGRHTGGAEEEQKKWGAAKEDVPQRLKPQDQTGLMARLKPCP
jgi:hypothetical protein